MSSGSSGSRSSRSRIETCKVYRPAAAAVLQRRYADFRMKPTYTGPLTMPHKLSRSMSYGRRSTRRHRHRHQKTYGGDGSDSDNNSEDGKYDTWAAEGYTQKMFDDATKVNKIGTGAFGKVFTIRLPNGHIVVQKDVNYDTADRCSFAKMIKNEADALKELSELAHLREHISPLIGYKLRKHSSDDIEYGPFTSSFYMEFMKGMELFDFINKFFTERKALDPTFIQSIHNRTEWILQNIHNAGWCHRDISPENIFMILDDYGNFIRPIIIDFGLACRNMGDGCLLPLAGKGPYMNEHYKRQPVNAYGRIKYISEYDFGSLGKTSAIWVYYNDQVRAAQAASVKVAEGPAEAAVAAAAGPVHVAAPKVHEGPGGAAGLSIRAPGKPAATAAEGPGGSFMGLSIRAPGAPTKPKYGGYRKITRRLRNRRRH